MSRVSMATTLGLTATLIASGVIGARILATDEWLWTATPSHAYGLLAFAALDFALAVVVQLRMKLAKLGAVALASTQFAAMLVDFTLYSPNGVPAGIFRSYLLGDTLFVVLLLIQPVIALLSLFFRKGTLSLSKEFR